MYSIRKAIPDDAKSISEIYVDSWRNTYAGLLPDDMLVGLDANAREARWWRHALADRPGRQAAFVAEGYGLGVVGFASGGAARDRRFSYDGEVYTLYLLDDHHEIGLGKRLFITIAARLIETRGPSLIVWVLKGNPARFFYEALGGKLVGHRHGTMGGTSIEEFGFAWEDARSLIALGRQDRDGSTGRV